MSLRYNFTSITCCKAVLYTCLCYVYLLLLSQICFNFIKIFLRDQIFFSIFSIFQIKVLKVGLDRMDKYALREFPSTYAPIRLTSQSHYNWRAVTQSLMVSSPSTGLWLDIWSVLWFILFQNWGALSEDTTGLYLFRSPNCVNYTYLYI